MSTETQAKGMRVHTSWMRYLLTFLMVFGPGLIVMVADNDAGAVSTYIQAGAQYGKSLLWMLVLLLPITYFVQEMGLRLGIATGQGCAKMIFRRFGKRWGLFSLLNLLLVNFLTLVTEFAAIDLAAAQFGVSPYLSVPFSAICLILIVITGSYLRWERLSIFLCLLDALWFVLAWKVHPSLDVESVLPRLPAAGLTANFWFLIIAVVGTTVAPWQVFFQQSCVADKRLRFADLNWSRLDTLIGAIFTIGVAACMMLVGDYAYEHKLPFVDPAHMATSLMPFMGTFVGIAVPLLMINAAVLGTMAVSLSSAWAYGEVQGWPHSLQRSFHEAPGFYSVYVACVLAAAGLVLIPRAPLQLVIIAVQVMAGVMLPSILIFMQLMSSDKELLGEKFVNKRWNNWVNWFIIVVLFVLSFVLAAQVIVPQLFPA